MMIPTTFDYDDDERAIPLIDLSQNDDAAVAKKLIQALASIGFATLVIHGVEQTVVEGFTASKSFFDLPTETKRQYEYQSHTSNRGYIPLGSESHKTQPDQKETFDIGKEGEIGFETPWPSSELPGFKENVLHYFQEFDRLNLRLMKLLEIGLQLADDNFFVIGATSNTAICDSCTIRNCNDQSVQPKKQLLLPEEPLTRTLVPLRYSFKI
jgi:isopenicillin N synthase-like dioxygenase